ncbi:MAG: hypothetical protein JXR70_09865 [Spirochaetales bacterium]|nr:hypothetical protein [Spirochaetales bacterium]
MPIIFKNIRRKLAAQNRAAAYIRYALGEIVLVVIGILIALQVNNWNQERKDKQHLNNILQEIQGDLLSDIHHINLFLPGGKRLDSLATRIIDGKITEEEYKDPKKYYLFWVGLTYTPFYQQNNAYKKIEDFSGNIPDSYDLLLSRLNDFYVTESNTLNDVEKTFNNTIEARHQYLSRTYSWYHLLRNHKYNHAMLEWYLHSDQYKNFVSRYKADQIAKPDGLLFSYQLHAAALYIRISDFLGIKKIPPEIPALGLIHSHDSTEYSGNPNYLKKYNGTYQGPEKYQIIIKAEHGFLLIHTSNAGSISLIFRHIKEDTFKWITNNYDYSITFTYDNKHHVNGFQDHNSGGKSDFHKKIK